MTTSVLRAPLAPPRPVPLPHLADWGQELARRFQGLSPVFVTLLSLWTFGMLLAHSCGLDTVSLHLARLLGQAVNTVRQRLREFYQEAGAKAGAKHGVKRRDFQVAACFVPLLQWVLSFWSCRRLALALDVTNLGDRFHVLCISVLYGGIGIPVAWKIVPGNAKESWHAVWCELLGGLQAALDPSWTVVVLSDRGLESAQLFHVIVAAGWHPLMRVKARHTFQPLGWTRWYRLEQLVPRVGCRFTAPGRAYRTAREPLVCTLLGCWEASHQESWLLLTDLPTAAAAPGWYAFRAWIEQGFKVIKSEALQWQRTRMTQAERAERLWLAIAVSVLWLVVIGAAVEGDERRETLGRVRQPTPASPPDRRHRLFALGWAEWTAALIRGRPLPIRKLPPERWADEWQHVALLTEKQFCAHELYP
jgi:hypothetical protein